MGKSKQIIEFVDSNKGKLANSILFQKRSFYSFDESSFAYMLASFFLSHEIGSQMEGVGFSDVRSEEGFCQENDNRNYFHFHPAVYANIVEFLRNNQFKYSVHTYNDNNVKRKKIYIELPVD